VEILTVASQATHRNRARHAEPFSDRAAETRLCSENIVGTFLDVAMSMTS